MLAQNSYLKKFETKKSSNNTLSTNFDISIFKIINIKQQIEEQKIFNFYSFGKYYNLSSCRVCNNSLTEIFSFIMPLAGGFISKKSRKKE